VADTYTITLSAASAVVGDPADTFVGRDGANNLITSGT
jgi:hypothetical protein